MSKSSQQERSEEDLAAEFFSLVENEAWADLDAFIIKPEATEWGFLVSKLLRQMSIGERTEFNNFLETR